MNAVADLQRQFECARVAKDQPAKLAGFEGLYNTTSNAPLVLVGYVDEQQQKVVGIAIPDMLTSLVHPQLTGVPVVIAYTICIYWIFRGKVKLDRMRY